MITFLLDIITSGLFIKLFTIYCVSLYLFILYYITTLTSVDCIKFLLVALAFGCIVGEILGIGAVWYLDNFYYPTIQNPTNINEIMPEIESIKQNTETFINEDDIIKKNTRNTVKWFSIVFIGFYIFARL